MDSGSYSNSVGETRGGNDNVNSKKEDVVSLIKDLRQRKRDGTLIGHQVGLQELLTDTDAFNQSAYWVMVLEAHTPPANTLPEQSTYIQCCCTLLSKLNPDHANHVSKELINLCQEFTRIVVQVQNAPLRAVLPLYKAAKAFETEQFLINPLHVLLFKVCLLANHYTYVMPILEEIRVDVDGNSGINSQYILSYYYYGALILVNLKEYKTAVLYLTLALSIKTSSKSQIMLQAYKKLLLVSYLVLGKHGAETLIPSNTADMLGINEKTRKEIAAYIEVKENIENPEFATISIEPEKHALFVKDHNLGLIELARQSAARHKLVKVLRPFNRIPIMDCYNKLGLAHNAEANEPEAVQEYIGKLIAEIKDKVIFSKTLGFNYCIDDETKTVHQGFHFVESNRMYNELNKAMVSIQQLNQKLARSDVKIAMSKSYLNMQRKQEVDRSVW